jgi:toxin CptA
MNGPLRLRLKRSKSLALLLCAVHALAGAALWASPLPALASVAGSALLALSAALSVRRHALRTTPGSVVELELYEDCTLSACTGDGRWLQYRIAGSSFCSRMLTVLNLRGESAWEVHSVLISADSVDPDAFRRLRVWLRWRCAGVSLNGIDGK